jgi:hypothetical protein
VTNKTCPQNRQVFTAVDIYDIRLTFKQIAIASEEFCGSPLSFHSKAAGIFIIKKGKNKIKSCPIHTMQTLRGRGNIAPPNSLPRH